MFIEFLPPAALILVVAGSVWLLWAPFAKLFEIYKTVGQLSTVRVTTGINDDDHAIAALLELVQEAKETLEVLDDGNNVPESVYNQETVVEALRHKLRHTSELEVTCYFNEDEDLLFRREFEGNPRVHIHAGIQPGGTRAVDQVHFKIADGGRLAYLTRHRPGENRREYRKLDTRHFDDKRFGQVASTLYDGILTGARQHA